MQTAKFDKTSKSLLSYISNKFDYRIRRDFWEKDKSVGLALLLKPVPSMKKDPTDPTKTVLDKDGVALIKYQCTLKKYIEQEN